MNWFKRIAAFWKTIQVVLLYLVSITLVFLMYPREGKFQYEYTKNKPWMHQDLIAPFDFPIYKDEARLNEERDSIAEHTPLHFTVDTTVVHEMLAVFRSDYNLSEEADRLDEPVSGPEEQMIDTLPGLLQHLYSRGVIERHPVMQSLQSDEPVMVVQRQVAEQSTLEELFNEKEAYEYLVDKLREVTLLSENDIVAEVPLTEYIRPNVLYDQSMTEKVAESRLDQLARTQGMVQSGQIIINRGELVSQGKYRLIESLRQEYETNPNVSKNYPMLYLGQFILIALLFLALFWYVSNFRQEMMSSRTQTLFILLLVLVMVALTNVTVNTESISYFVIPFAIIPIFLKTFYNVRFALFVHTLILLLAGFWVPNSYQFILINFLAGVVAVFSMRSYYKRGILFYIALFVALTYMLLYIILSLLQEGTFEGVNWFDLLWFAGNGLLILTVYPLIYLFERLFGFLSDATLFELSDTNQPLLRKLAEKAPGTFQHSLQVANLAEEAVLKVGGNPLLVRTGALYHDIGKMDNPYYFIENQRNDHNPHKNTDFKTSARIIIDHVKRGVEIAKKSNLPRGIIDFICTHHGTSTVQYFYRSYLNDNPGEEVDIEEFRYPGPKPHTREMAVLMIADSVEAASRSLKEIDEKKINELVDKIVERQTQEEQYTEADITFRDLTEIKKIFKSKLINIYHARIEYPE